MSAHSTSIPGRGFLWQTAQLLGLLLTAALLVALWQWPHLSLRVLWYAIIPVLPAVFLVHPGLWRNVCPLATLNMLPGRYSRGRVLGPRGIGLATGFGIVLLAALVPARRFVFNTDGPALAMVVIAVALLSLAMGFVFDRKAGFCNAFCPVLPVERLYGQDPLTDVSNPRCPTCTLCTRKGCVDLTPRRSAQAAASASGHRWLFTPYGTFAAAFPGFVVSYYLVPDGGWADAGSVYLRIASGSVLSWAVVASVVAGFRPKSRAALPVLGIFALGLYYWFGAPGIAEAWSLGSSFTLSVRIASLILIGVWLWRRPSRSDVGPRASRSSALG